MIHPGDVIVVHLPSSPQGQSLIHRASLCRQIKVINVGPDIILGFPTLECCPSARLNEAASS